jgi:uridine kinase
MTPRARSTPLKSPHAVLVVGGVFLLREQLRDLWTLSVYVRVSARVTAPRGSP